MAAALGNHDFASAASSPATTPAFNATGATLLWAVVSWYGTTITPTVSDSGENTWRALTAYRSSNSNIQIYYAYDKAGAALSLSASHTITLSTSPTGSYPLVFGGAATGTLTTSSVLVGSNGAADSGMVTGAVAGVSAGDLVIAAVATDTSAGFSVSAGGVAIFDEQDGGDGMMGAAASKVSSDTSNANVTFTGGSGARPCAIVVFKAAASGSTPLTFSATDAAGSGADSLAGRRAMNAAATDNLNA